MSELTIGKTVRRFCRGAQANVAVVFALSLPLVIGGAGLGVETSYWYYKDLVLQAAADAAAYAGAIEKRSGSSNDVVTTVATASASDNGFDSSIGTIVVHSPPTSGAFAGGQAVEVILTQPVERFFTRIFNNAPVEEYARAVANYESSGSACILGLDPSVPSAVLFSGNTNLTVTGCNVMANSISGTAIKSQGSATAHVNCFISGGGVSLTSGTTQSDPTCPVLHAAAVGDPYSLLPVPTNTNASQTTGSSNYNAVKRVYTAGLTLKNTIDVQPGTYLISGGDLTVNANASITCSLCTGGAGVTFYLSGSSRVSMNGNATVQLAAPTTGTYSGILFFGDRNNSGTSVNKFNGTASSKLTGDIYFKSQAVQYLGNFSGLDGCTRIIANTIEWSGNTTINQNCSAHGMGNIPSSVLVRLAE
jgi:hypothetical protein